MYLGGVSYWHIPFFFVLCIYKQKGNMTDQTDQLIAEVQSKNKAENYERENTIKLHTLQDIYRNSNKLDNITEHMLKKFNYILLGGRQW